MRGAIVTAILVLGGGTGTVHAAVAEPHQRDVAATRAYLVALQGLALAARKDTAAAQAEAIALIERVRSQCPDVLAGAGASYQRALTEEASLDVEYAQAAPARPAFDAFARAIERLRWTSPRLTHYVRRLGEATTVYYDIVVPDICADAADFTADRFLAPETERFLEQHAAAEEELYVNESGDSAVPLSDTVLHLLARYERADDRRLLPRKPTNAEEVADEVADEKATFTETLELERALGLFGRLFGP